GTWPAEIRFSIDSADVSASSWRWKLRGEHAVHGSQGTLQLDIELESASIRVTKHYVVYPQTSVFRDWLTLKTCPAKPCASTTWTSSTPAYLVLSRRISNSTI